MSARSSLNWRRLTRKTSAVFAPGSSDRSGILASERPDGYHRWAGENLKQLPELADDLVRHKDVIIARRARRSARNQRRRSLGRLRNHRWQDARLESERDRRRPWSHQEHRGRLLGDASAGPMEPRG